MRTRDVKSHPILCYMGYKAVKLIFVFGCLSSKICALQLWQFGLGNKKQCEAATFGALYNNFLELRVAYV